MSSGAKIFIENGPNDWYRPDTGQTYILSEVTIHVRVEKLTYQRSLGELEDARFFGVGKLDVALCASGHPDTLTREVSLILRGSVEATIKKLKGDKVTGSIRDDEANKAIDHLTTRGLGAALSYFRETGADEPAMWFLEVALTKSNFDDIINSYRARLLRGMLIRIKSTLLTQESPMPGLIYLNWDNVRQLNKTPIIELELLSWLEPELPLEEWPF